MRLLSYNIHKGIGGRDRRYRLERIIQVIEHENPDLICLQEVEPDVCDELGRQLGPLGYEFRYAQKGGGRPDGCAIFVRTSALKIGGGA